MSSSRQNTLKSSNARRPERKTQPKNLDAGDEAATWNDLGNAYAALGFAQKAIADFDEALKIERAVGNTRFEAIAIHAEANVYQNIARTAEAAQS